MQLLHEYFGHPSERVHDCSLTAEIRGEETGETREQPRALLNGDPFILGDSRTILCMNTDPFCAVWACWRGAEFLRGRCDPP